MLSLPCTPSRSRTMSVMDVANKLVGLVREGKNFEAIETLYADDVVSIEAGPADNPMRVLAGKEGVLAKSKWWYENMETHSGSVTDPRPCDDQFICEFTYDVTDKAKGHRFVMSEYALYTVKDGKIAKEQFFYSM
jgi:ketosteroid isomerase-like protein